MTSRLGCYYAPEHSRASDRDYITKLQPPVIRLLDCDVQHIADMHALAPNAIIAPRTWVIDDHDGAAVRNLMADPVATGRDHAKQYSWQWDRWRSEATQRGLILPATDHIYFNSANEPNQGGTPDKIAAYNIAFLNHCTELGIHATALCLGVGWPDNTGPDTPVDWSPYAGIVEPIKRGSHWLELHEYNYDSGPQDGWRWLAGRHLQCPFDVPILLGEIGVDNYVDAKRWQREGGNRGWQGNVSPDQYAEMIEQHIRGCDTRVVAALPFITDYRNNAWESFDTSTAHGALLARKDNMVPTATPPVETHLPSIIVGDGPTPVTPPQKTTTAYVAATAGANLRLTPITGDILTAIPFGARVDVMDNDDDATWLIVRYAGITGWIRRDLLSDTQPEPVEPVEPPTPAPMPTGDNWQRCRAFVKRWEGGWADNPDDPGGATNKGITIGTYTQWLREHGQAVPTKDDLRNISDEEADRIFYEWYWLRSGADKVEWPLCLAHFDTAVNAGPGRAAEMMQKSGGNFLAYMGHLMTWYTQIKNFEIFGRAWIRRRAEILLEAAK